MAEPIPLIAVTADIGEEDGYRWHAAEETYLRAVAGAGMIPIIVPSLDPPVEAAPVLARVDGLLVTGARSNVHPSLYGEEERDHSGPFDRQRDATSLALIRAALAMDLPILAICRGLQELNVALGGTLAAEIQNLPGRIDHRAPEVQGNDRRFAIRQPVHLTAGGRLAGILGGDTIRVNSLHRQGIDRLAPKLKVEGVAEDGTVEAVSVAGSSFAIGVQWHPEYWAASDPASRQLFDAFARAVHARRGEQPIAAEQPLRV